MAIYHLRIKSISRGAGRSATGAAAYRAGERIRDERTGVLHNHAGRRDVSHKEIVLPQHLDASELAWASDRSRLWNAAEMAEKRRDARVAREYEVALPPELSHLQRVELTRTFSRELADRHRVAIDLAVHDPRPTGDPRNYHAHLLVTTREICGAGMGPKAGLDMSSAAREQLSQPPGIVEFNVIRERWSTLTNEALSQAGLSVRVDHRSYLTRGIDREPKPHIPYAAIQAERHGVRSEIAEQLRERYRARVQERALRREPQQLSEVIIATKEPSPVASSVEPNLEQVRQGARQAWLQMRHEALQHAALQPAMERAVGLCTAHVAGGFQSSKTNGEAVAYSRFDIGARQRRQGLRNMRIGMHRVERGAVLGSVATLDEASRGESRLSAVG